MHRNVLLALDGLGTDEFLFFATYCASLLNYSRTCNVYSVRGDAFLCNSQTTWSTLLTGKAWYEHRCVGYSKPGGNLDEPRVFDLSQLGDIALFDTASPAETALVNVPLLANELAFKGQPQHRPQKPGFNPELIWQRAVEEDIDRIRETGELLKTEVKSVVCRLGSFDVGGHLLFDELFAQPYRTRREPRLRSLGTAIDTLFQQAATHHFEITVLSNYSFERCSRVININHILEGGGYCVVNLESKSRRVLALKALHGDTDALRWHINPERSRACSTVHGTIHLNTRERFTKGILTETAADSLRNELPLFLAEACKIRHGLDLQWQTSDDPLLPDLVFRIPGADFTFCDQRLPGDTPAGVHSPRGFIAGPGRNEQLNSLSAVEASQMVTRVFQGGKV